MAEIIGVLIVGIIGFIIGGVVGLNSELASWSPYCWYGAIIAMVVAVGGPICGHILD